MPWCPKCKQEYREGYSVCADCKIALVNELKKEEPRQKNKQPVDSEPCLLISLCDGLKTELLTGILKANHIPYYIMDTAPHTSLTQRIRGSVFTNDIFNIYVSIEDIERAKQLAADFFD